MFDVVNHVVQTLDVRLDVASSDKSLLIRVDDIADVSLETEGQDTREDFDVHVEQTDGPVVFRLRLGSFLVQQDKRADKL